MFSTLMFRLKAPVTVLLSIDIYSGYSNVEPVMLMVKSPPDNVLPLITTLRPVSPPLKMAALAVLVTVVAGVVMMQFRMLSCDAVFSSTTVRPLVVL